jgi:predicted GNAT superfamily acetyltransferase
MEIEFRYLTKTEELEPFVDLQLDIWGVPERNAVPSNIIHAMILSGGVAIGAYDTGNMIGMSMALPCVREGTVGLWSHMTGVHPGYQDHKVGFELKQLQREWALEHQYRTIYWTFDPMQRGNAHFNLNLLGAESNTYHVDLYGNTLATLNPGLATDRLEVKWVLDAPHVAALAREEPIPPRVSHYSHDAFLLSYDGELHHHPAADSHTYHFVEIHPHLKQLREQNFTIMQQWQLKIRETLQTMFARGAVLVDFIQQDGRCWYVLKNRL